MPEGQFIFDKSGKPIAARPEPQVFEPTGTLNTKCPTCGNRYTTDLPGRNTSGKSKVTTRKVRCDDCDTTFESPLDAPIPQRYKRPPKLGKFR